MKQIKKMKVHLLVILIMASVVFLSGCQTEGAGVLNSHEVAASEHRTKAVVLDRSMMPTWWENVWDEGKLSLENPVFRKLKGTDLNEGIAEIRNRNSEKNMEIEVSTVFRDEDNVIADSSVWQKFNLTPNQTIVYKINSLVPSYNYTIRVRAPRKNTNAINGPGLQLMADLMLRSIMRNYHYISNTARPKVALQKFNNRTSQVFDDSIFITKLRAEANSKVPGKFRFVSRRSDVLSAVKKERHEKREMELDSDESNFKAGISGVDYFLTGALRTLAGIIIIFLLISLLMQKIQIFFGKGSLK